MSEISAWLEGLGLSQYADVFEANEIDLDLVRDLDDEALEKLGVPIMGHRLRLLRALQNLGSEAPAAPAPRVAAAERRQISVMFCDMVGSTALSEQLDPEDLRAVMQGYQRACGDVIERYGGHVAQYLGDGLMVYFGWPAAHEDDVQRAISAGLDLVEAVKSVEAREPIQVRVGIATGPVVVGEADEGDASVPKTAVGQTPNHAARLETLAQPDEVLVADTTHRLAGGAFEYVDLGEHDLKGLAGRPRVWRVLSESRAGGRFEERSVGGVIPLVGRKTESDLLMDRWLQARECDGQVVLLAGEPGIGKSRLTEALRERVAEEAHVERRYQCSPYFSNSSFHPIIAEWKRAAGFARGQSDEERLDRLESALAAETKDRRTVAALFASLLSLSGDRIAPLNSPKKQKDDTIDALAEQLVLASKDAPLLAIFEDVHWIDPTSLEALSAFVERVRGERILLLVTHRLEFAPSWVDEEHVAAYRLNRLTRAQCADMIAKVAKGKSLPDEVLDHIVAKSDCVPLFAEEMTKATLEAGVLVEESGRYILEGSLQSLAIPASLQESLVARLDRLPLARDVARIGSVIGREFPHELLRRIARLEEQDLQERMEALNRAQLVFTRGKPPDSVHYFKHALVQEVAYESLLKAVRIDLHRRIFDTLESSFPETVLSQPEVLARHARAAGEAGSAASYWLTAGQRALDRSATNEAIAHLTAGLDQVLTLEPSPQRDQRELPFHAFLGTAQMFAKGWAAPEVERAYSLANELCRSVERLEEAVWPLWGVWVFHFVRGEVNHGRPTADRIREVAEESGDRIASLVAHMILTQMMLYTGRFEAAKLHWERAEELYVSPDDQALIKLYSTDLLLTVRLHWSHALWMLGFPDQAGSLCAENIEYAGKLNHPYSESWALTWGAIPYLHRGDHDELLRRVEAGIHIAEDHGFAYLAAMGAMERGFAEARLGSLEQGIESMRLGLEQFSATGAGIVVPFFQTLLAELLVDADRRDEAHQLLDVAAAQVERWGEGWQEAEIYRVRGRAQETLATADAEASYRRAVEIASSQGARGWELRARTALAKLLHGQEREEAARGVLESILPEFDEGLDTADLRVARSLAAEISPRP